MQIQLDKVGLEKLEDLTEAIWALVQALEALPFPPPAKGAIVATKESDK